MTRMPATDEKIIRDALKEHGTVTPTGVQVSAEFFPELDKKLNAGQRTLGDLIGDMAAHSKQERERKEAEAKTNDGS